MNRKPLYILFVTLAVLGIVHVVSLELSFYWQYRWLDIPVHFIAGAMVGFFPFVLAGLRVPIVRRYTGFVPAMLFVVLVGLAWEVFEIWAGLPLIEDDFEKDIALDLLMDLLGGVVGFSLGNRMVTTQ